MVEFWYNKHDKKFIQIKKQQNFNGFISCPYNYLQNDKVTKLVFKRSCIWDYFLGELQLGLNVLFRIIDIYTYIQKTKIKKLGLHQPI